jgi:hypothetical protein
LAIDLRDKEALVGRLKEYISEPRDRIRLDDLVSAEIRSASYEIREDEFPLQTSIVTEENIAERLRKYENAVSRLMTTTILLGRWGTSEHQPLIERVIARLTDGTEPRSGRSAWIGLRWYPVMLLLYSGGIAALSSHNYLSLSTMLTTRLSGSKSGLNSEPAVVSTVEAILELDRMDLFKSLPGYQNLYAPRSEYLFKSLQPDLEDLLFLGNGYEDLFDRFEFLYALCYLDLQTQQTGYTWAPPGRSGWKARQGRGPHEDIIEDARRSGVTWGPISMGLFRGSIERFNSLATAFREQVLDKLARW